MKLRHTQRVLNTSDVVHTRRTEPQNTKMPIRDCTPGVYLSCGRLCDILIQLLVYVAHVSMTGNRRGLWAALAGALAFLSHHGWRLLRLERLGEGSTRDGHRHESRLRNSVLRA